MDRPFEEILLSRPITFVVGPDEKEFTIHEKVLSSISKPLSALLTGNMREAKECRIVWDDVDEQTFVRFSQWAYLADYKEGAPDIYLDHSSIATDMFSDYLLIATDVFSDSLPITSPPNQQAKPVFKYSLKSIAMVDQNPKFIRTSYLNQKIVSKRANMVNAFISSKDWLSPTPTPFTPRANDDPFEDYTNVFLSHARLYVLGDKYDILPLCKLAAHKLNETLKESQIYEGKMGCILALTEYVFENTRSDDKIRSRLVHYMACIVEDLAKEADFTSFVERQPEAASALMAKMAERLD